MIEYCANCGAELVWQDEILPGLCLACQDAKREAEQEDDQCNT